MAVVAQVKISVIVPKSEDGVWLESKLDELADAVEMIDYAAIVMQKLEETEAGKELKSRNALTVKVE